MIGREQENHDERRATVPKVTIGGTESELEQLSSFKALRAMRVVKAVFEEYPELLTEMEKYRRDYEAANQVPMSRSAALFRFGPDRLGHLTDADWEASGNQLVLPRSPGLEEQVLHIFPKAFDTAERHMLRLCALVLISNSDLERADIAGGDAEVEKVIEERAKRLPHEAMADELPELLTVAVEVVQEQIGTKVKGLQERLGNALRLFGLGRQSSTEQPIEETPAQSTDPESEREGSPTRPPSSSSSDAPSDGNGEPSSIEPAGSSPSSSVPA